MYLAEMMPMREALLDPRWRLPALAYLTAAARATDMGGPGPAQCTGPQFVYGRSPLCKDVLAHMACSVRTACVYPAFARLHSRWP